MALEEYRRKRHFARSPEPRGRTAPRRGHDPAFVVQKHWARRLHFDFRLEMGGVLKSWAVPKGPSLDPADKRLAVAVEDHPLEYGGFEGTIPQGAYGGGTVMLWDRGTWRSDGDPEAGYAKGVLKFTLAGHRLKGAWTLVQMKGARAGDGKNWLLIKERDRIARPGAGAALVERYERSVASRRTMAGIEAAKEPPRRRRAAAPPPIPRPALAVLGTVAPEGPGWLHEIKFDGYRMLARIAGGAVTMASRNGKDWSHRLPAIEAALAGLRVASAVLDGEVVHLAANGVSSFTALKDDLAAGRSDGLVYFVFDLLHRDGKAWAPAPLGERKRALAALLAGRDAGPVRLSEHVVGHGGQFFAKACALGLEGIVSKRIDAPYRSGRNGDWRKTKCVRQGSFVVVGWTDPAGKRRGLGALLLARADEAGALHYAGGVGTGFTAPVLAELAASLAPLAQETPAAEDAAKAAPRAAHWVRPVLRAEVRYAEWTGDARLRHPVFIGWHEEKAPVPAGAAVRSPRGAVEICGVHLTHPEKLLYRTPPLTKRALADYYVAVAPHMLPHVAGRPLSLLRCPDGADGKCFYQKHPGPSVPTALKTVAIAENSGEETYVVVEDAAGLVALVQMGVLEIHPWGATSHAPDRPDRVIFDLDPDAGLPWQRVVEAALAVRDRLAEMGLQSFAKTTGGKGIHVVLPLRPNYGWDEVKAFARGLAEEFVRDAPHSYTSSPRIKARHGRIFVDYLRNERGATAIAPFSPRARPGAPVAVPLSWREVEALLRPDEWTVATLPAHLAGRRDPWAELAGLRQTLPPISTPPATTARR